MADPVRTAEPLGRRRPRPSSQRPDESSGPLDVTVTVTPPSGPPVEGRLERIDDFVVASMLSDGGGGRSGASETSPKVEIHDPLAGHKQLLETYTDRDIHNVTAYLVTAEMRTRTAASRGAARVAVLAAGPGSAPARSRRRRPFALAASARRILADLLGRLHRASIQRAHAGEPRRSSTCTLAWVS